MPLNAEQFTQNHVVASACEAKGTAGRHHSDELAKIDGLALDTAQLVQHVLTC